MSASRQKTKQNKTNLISSSLIRLTKPNSHSTMKLYLLKTHFERFLKPRKRVPLTTATLRSTARTHSCPQSSQGALAKPCGTRLSPHQCSCSAKDCLPVRNSSYIAYSHLQTKRWFFTPLSYNLKRKTTKSPQNIKDWKKKRTGPTVSQKWNGESKN